MIPRVRFLVQSNTAVAASAQLPRLLDFDKKKRDIDIFIAAGGFEKRTLAFPQALFENSSRILGASLIGCYQTNLEDNARRMMELRPLLEMVGAGRAPELFEADAPSLVMDRVQGVVNRLYSGRRLKVVFDISGASSTLIFSVLGSLFRLRSKVDLEVFYATAGSYYEPSNLNDGNNLELIGSNERESGVSDVLTNELYLGHHHDHMPNRVIAFPSMFTERLQRCITHVGVSPLTEADGSVFWILPTTDADAHSWRQDHTRRAVLTIMRSTGLFGSDQDFFDDKVISCDVFDYQKAFQVVIEKVDELAGSNISLIHMGTKLHAVGAALAMNVRSEVAFVYARPVSFNASKYSDGIGELYSINFGQLDNLHEILTNVGDLEIRTI